MRTRADTPALSSLRARARRRPAPAGRPARQEVTSAAYQRLRELVVAGRLAPGAPLIETELSARLGVSRTPVRAALQRLQQEGFVSAWRAGSMLRAAVAPLTAEDMREVFLMVGALESAAARMAAALEPAAREALAGEMARLADDLHAASASRPPDIVRAHELHVRFHRICTAAGAGRRLRAELEVLQPQAERYERVYASAVVHAFDEASREHAAIVEALRAGDGDAAERAVQLNWRGSAERYGHVVTILGERGNW
jgi:DNA-binding GntR family transcriptional regulator